VCWDIYVKIYIYLYSVFGMISYGKDEDDTGGVDGNFVDGCSIG